MVRQFRAAASFVAFINPLTVTLFSLVPGTNVGYPALVLGASGLTFYGGGNSPDTGTPVPGHYRFATTGARNLAIARIRVRACFRGRAPINVHDRSALANIGNILIVSLLIGIARAWEFVGDWNTGIWSSIGLIMVPSRHSKGPEPRRRGQTAPTSWAKGQDDQTGIR